MTTETHIKHRSHLPIPSRERTGPMVYDAKDPEATCPRIRRMRPPVGAPNVLVVLLDDAGFVRVDAATVCFDLQQDRVDLQIEDLAFRCDDLFFDLIELLSHRGIEICGAYCLAV